MRSPCAVRRIARVSALAAAAALVFGAVTAPATASTIGARPRVSPVSTAVKRVLCLSWSYKTGQPWNCAKWYSQQASVGIAGTSVYDQTSGGWKRSPYTYNPATHTATYDYRLDSSLRQPAFTSLGSSTAYAFDDAFASDHTTKTPNVKWAACKSIHWTLDFHGATGSGLVEATELARWKKVFARVTSAAGGVSFIHDTDSIYAAGSVSPGFQDGRIHITYSAASGQYHSNKVQEPLGFGGLTWKILGTTPRQVSVLYGYVIIDAKKAANILTWPSPSRPAGIDELTNLYQHELGHALGLQHTSDKYQIMYPQLLPQLPNRFGAGDIAALRKLFPAVPCPTITPAPTRS